jgi:hypothetical protein
MISQLSPSNHNDLQTARLCENVPGGGELEKTGKFYEMKDDDGKPVPERVTKDSRLLPLAKKLLEWNTPDVQDGRAKSYIIIAPAMTSNNKPGPNDNLEQAASILDAVLKLNPKAGIDLIVCGTSESGWMPIERPGLRITKASTPEDVRSALTGLLKQRLEGMAVSATPAAKAVVPPSV